jgi:hypothetical protein
VRTPDEGDETTIRLFDMDCTVLQGAFTVTDFVYAFERGHSRSPDRKLFRSEALIERDESSGPTDGSSVSWRDELDNVTKETYAPVGQRYHTQGLELTFSRQGFAERLEGFDADELPWTTALASLEQAVIKAVAIVAESDQQDFRVKTTLTEDTIEVLVVDSRQGGNGITWRIAQELTSEFPDVVRAVADCTSCAGFCEECLLLSRTPPAYLENDLLDKHVLRAVLSKPTETSAS